MIPDDDPIHGNCLPSRHICIDILPMRCSIYKIFFHESKSPECFPGFRRDLIHNAIAGVQQADTVLFLICPRCQLTILRHLDPVLFDSLCQDLYRRIRKVDLKDHPSIGQPCFPLTIGHRQLANILFDHFERPVTWQEELFLHRIQKRIISAEQDSAHTFITSPVHISDDQKIHTSRIFHIEDTEVMGIIQSPRIFFVLESVDPAQTVLSKIITPELSLTDKSDHILFIIFFIIQFLALNAEPDLSIRHHLGSNFKYLIRCTLICIQIDAIR